MQVGNRRLILNGEACLQEDQLEAVLVSDLLVLLRRDLLSWTCHVVKNEDVGIRR